MHLHMIAGVVLHATAMAVIGFFVLFAASKASGIVRAVGTALGWWLWLLAALFIVCALARPWMGDKDHGWMNDRWKMGGWMHDEAPSSTAPPAAPQTQPAPK
jgi:hypothetical protein